MRAARTACACLFVIAVVWPLNAGAPPLPRATPESVGLDSSRLQAATELLKQYVADRKISGAVAAVARHGKVAYLETVGVQDLQSGAPMTERSLFRIYSMTKSVTAVAVMMLHEQGRFALTDPVSKFLPDFKDVVVTVEPDVATRKPERQITVQDLLLHTSGLSHRTSPLYRNAKVRSRSITLPQFITNIVRTPLMEDPGTRYRYSEATTVLGRLVEVWARVPFDQFVQNRVLKPLAMNDTSFWVTPDAVARLATVYTPAEGGGIAPIEIEEVPFTVRPALIEGAVGLVSTVPDYLRFCQMLLSKGELDGARLLTVKTVELITSNGLPPSILASRGGTMGWGLANVNVQMDPASPLRGEYGWDGTAGTIFWIDPAREMITILMTQRSPADPDGLRGRFKTLTQAAVR
jgi:CubicO group peptidase (beta-lactamase class C family)